MREKIVPMVLFVALAGLGVFAAVRTKPPHEAPLVRIQEEGTDASADAPSALADASALAEVADALAAPMPVADGSPVSPAPQVVKLLDRPLRVVTLGPALAAPGTMAFEVGAAKPFDLELCPVESPQRVEARLVRGGADAEGADIAIVALPDLVAATERLRALEPQAFLLVGFSQAAERLVPTAPGARAPAATGDVKVFVPAGERLASRQWMALFALDEAGAEPSRVKLLVADERPKDASFVSGSFLDKNDGEHLLSTVEAAGLIPYVAVTTKHTLTASEPLVRAFAQAWLAGMTRSHSDAGGAAKRVLSKEGAAFSSAAELTGELGGVVERLGRVSHVTLADNARLLGATPAAASRRAPLEAASGAMVDAFRDAGLLTLAPSWPLVERKVVSSLAKDLPPEPEKLDCSRSRRKPIASRKEAGATLDEAALLRHVEVDAIAFEGCALRVSLKGGEKPTTTFVQSARDKLGLSAQKLLVGATASPGPALLEIVPPSAP